MLTHKKKQIILVRHAKAVEREDWDGKDFDRPLTPEWEQSNQIVANYLRLIGVKPDMIVTSPAARTLMTAEMIGKRFHNHTIIHNKALYNEDIEWPRDAMKIHFDVVRKARNNADILMIVGHNNDLSEFASYLANEPVPSMKKWSVIVLSLPEDVDWKHVKPGSLKFIYYLTPHFLRLESLDK